MQTSSASFHYGRMESSCVSTYERSEGIAETVTVHDVFESAFASESESVFKRPQAPVGIQPVVVVGDNWNRHQEELRRTYRDPATVQALKAKDLAAIGHPLFKVRVVFHVWMKVVGIFETRQTRRRALNEESKRNSSAWWPHMETLEKGVCHLANQGKRLRFGESLRRMKNTWIARDYETAEMRMWTHDMKAQLLRCKDALRLAICQREFAERERDDARKEVAELKAALSRKNDLIGALFDEVQLLRRAQKVREGEGWFVPKGILSSSSSDADT